MKTKMITENQEDYLGIIGRIEEDKKKISKIVDTGVEASITEISKRMNVSKPSASEMLKNLKKQKLVDYKRYGKMTLTEKGKNESQRMIRKHRIIETFLEKTLKITKSKIHDLAHKLEHAFDDECIEKIYKLIGKPTHDPQGKLIPMNGGKRK